MIYPELYLCFVKIALFSIGGGYAAIPLVQNEVTSRGWMSVSDFINLISIAEMTPGPIAINSATFVGFRIAGVMGAIIATLGCITPSLIIVSMISYVYFRYKKMEGLQIFLKTIRPVIVALIISTGLSIFSVAIFNTNDILSISTSYLNIKSVIALAIFIFGLTTLRKTKTNAILVMVACSIIWTAFNILSGS